MTREAEDQPLGWSKTTLARNLECSIRHLDRLIAADPTFPEAFMIGTLRRWTPESVTAWRDSQFNARTRKRMGRLVAVKGAH